MNMTETTDDGSPGRTGTEHRTGSNDAGAVDAVGTYEADGAVVFYDSENPLAWVQSRETVALAEAV